MVNQGIKDSLSRWVKMGVYPGGFLTMVLENDLGAVCKADQENLANIADIYRYVFNNVPIECWGSCRKVKEWADIGGMSGKVNELLD